MKLDIYKTCIILINRLIKIVAILKRGIVVTRKDSFINEKIIGIPACFFLYFLSGD